MLVSLRYSIKNFRGIHGSWQLVHYHRMGGGDYRCRVGGYRGLLWEPIYVGHTELRSSEEVKHNFGHNVKTKYKRVIHFPGNLFEGRKEGKLNHAHRIISTSQVPIFLIEGPSVLTISRRTRRELGEKYLGQSYDQPEQVMSRMNNYSTRPSELPFLTSIPEKIPWALLRASNVIHEVHTSAKALPADQIIG